MEIYNETMFDLLSTLSTGVLDPPPPSYQTTALQVIEDDQGGVYVRGLTKHLARHEEDALNMLFEVHNDILYSIRNFHSLTRIFSFELVYPVFTGQSFLCRLHAYK